MHLRLQIAVVLCFLLLVGCMHLQESESQDRFQIVVSIPPLAEFAESIGGEHVSVDVLLPPGASPATYDPAPGRLRTLSGADAFIKVGTLPFEKANNDRFRTVNPDMRIVAAAENISAYPEAIDDPHVWLTPENAKRMVDSIYKAMREMDTQYAEEYRENRERYKARLERLDSTLRGHFGSAGHSSFLALHPAWKHLAHEYNLTQIPIQPDGNDPTAQQLSDLIDQVEREDIPVIVVQEQFSSKSAQVVAEETGADIIKLNPLGRHYIENMESIGDKMGEALQ